MTIQLSFDIIACDSATRYYRQQRLEKERFDAAEQENNEFWRRVKNLETYKKSKLNPDWNIAKYSVWSDRYLRNTELFEKDLDHSSCKKCCKHSVIVKRTYRRKEERELRETI